MPRLRTSLLRRASYISPYLLPLLRTCRDLRSAQNELRWLRDFVAARSSPSSTHLKRGLPACAQSKLLREVCRQRGRGRPLQYILGTQPFGDLEIQCRPGVLIPRWETENYTAHLAALLSRRSTLSNLRERESDDGEGSLTILDLCTGTGCISLLLYSLLSKHISQLQITGVDISTKALRLARQNLLLNTTRASVPISTKPQLRFISGNVLLEETFDDRNEWDVVISNPPYISQSSFWRDTSRSVRNFEPRLALVPEKSKFEGSERREGCDDIDRSGDVFYECILKIAMKARCKILVMEVADYDQAVRVMEIAERQGQAHWCAGEIWHDHPDGRHRAVNGIKGDHIRYTSVGSGNGRTVVLWTLEGGSWLRK